jgi:hypothetical protein
MSALRKLAILIYLTLVEMCCDPFDRDSGPTYGDGQ